MAQQSIITCNSSRKSDGASKKIAFIKLAGFVSRCPGVLYVILYLAKKDKGSSQQAQVEKSTLGFCYAQREVSCHIERLDAWSNATTSLSTSCSRYFKGGKTMPRKPKKPCAFPGCPELTDGRFCEKHKKQENARYEKYDRDPAVHRRYGRAWKRIRDSYVKTHPFCEMCFEEGRVVPVEEVHHKVPLAEGGTHARDNLISLCRSCHARIHAERGDRWGTTKKSHENS